MSRINKRYLRKPSSIHPLDLLDGAVQTVLQLAEMLSMSWIT